jgi:hypothetical protein
VESHFGFHGLSPADAVAPTMSSAASDVVTAANLMVMELTTTADRWVRQVAKMRTYAASEVFGNVHRRLRIDDRRKS